RLYLETDEHLDAAAVLAAAPQLSIGISTWYRWTWTTVGHLVPIQPEDVIGLTVAGMSHVARAANEIGRVLSALQTLVEAERSFTPNPIQVQRVEMSLAELASKSVPPDGTVRGNFPSVVRLGVTLSHEPATLRYLSSHQSMDENPTLWLTEP